MRWRLRSALDTGRPLGARMSGRLSEWKMIAAATALSNSSLLAVQCSILQYNDPDCLLAILRPLAQVTYNFGYNAFTHSTDGAVSPSATAAFEPSG
ncbi:hypothetical protein DFH06DRAFT_1319125 [Mycena polygramma]|nr:hypothetical protein DFH06DRAFT_1319125 [Mycena polygramma]